MGQDAAKKKSSSSGARSESLVASDPSFVDVLVSKFRMVATSFYCRGRNPLLGRDTVQLETAVSTISQEYLLLFTFEYGISEDLHPELPSPEERIVDFLEGKQDTREKHPSMLYQTFGFPENWNNRFFWVDESVFPTVADWRTSAPKDEMPSEDTYSPKAVMVLNTHRTLIQKQPEALLCLIGLSQRYFMGDDVYHTFLHDDDRDMDLFNLICASNPAKKWKIRPRQQILPGYPLDFASQNPSQQSTGGNRTEDQGQETVAPKVPPPENVTTTGVASEAGLVEEIATIGPRMIKERRKRGNDGVDTNAPPKVLRKDHADSRPTQSTVGGKSLASIGSSKGATVAGDPESKNTTFTSMVGSPESIYQPEWGVTNGCSLDTPEACQDLVDHIAPLQYFLELRHLHNDDFLKQYNINLARQVVMGSQLRLRFEHEAKLLKKFIAQVARRDQRIQARENEIKNLEVLLEAETDIKKSTEAKNAELGKELENLCALFLDLQVSNGRLSQQVSSLQAQVTGKEKIKVAFEEFKQYEDDRVEKRCAKIDARLDVLRIDFYEELYPHMLTTIAGRRWVIGHGLRLAVMK
nr:hypothetical protein [Tanacetum cinerariifolium]GEX84778.1 hypothetical protein [Tanacetum cinerariifolium]